MSNNNIMNINETYNKRLPNLFIKIKSLLKIVLAIFFILHKYQRENI